jgi:peptidoglycan/LPS O-acetylase OafA/YrhL
VSEEASARSLGHQPALDGLRGLAVLLVLVFHAAHDWLRGGYVGVDVFFVLSGFLITALLIGERARSGTISLPGFYRRRVARLLPALGLFLAGTGLLLVFVAKARGSAPYAYGAVGAIAFANNWIIVASGSALGHPLQPTWSLAVEEQFYLLWPLALLLLLRRGVGRTAILAIVVVLAGAAVTASLLWAHLSPSVNLYDSTLPHAVELLMGCALAVLWHQGRIPRLLSWTPTALAGFGVLAWLALRSRIDQNAPWDCWFAALSVLPLLAIGLERRGSGVSRILSIRPLRRVGRVSYGIYLYNLPVIMAVSHILPPIRGVNLWLSPLVRITAVYIVAELSWRFVEAPILKRFSRRRAPVPALPGVALEGDGA